MTDALHRLLRTPQGVLGLALLAVLLLACLLGGSLAPYSPEAMDFAGRFAPPGARHWLGADQLGRDVLSRLLIGARSTIPLAVAATFSAALVGACIGPLSPYLGGGWGDAVTRPIDAGMADAHLVLALILGVMACVTRSIREASDESGPAGPRLFARLPDARQFAARLAERDTFDRTERSAGAGG